MMKEKKLYRNVEKGKKTFGLETHINITTASGNTGYVFINTAAPHICNMRLPMARSECLNSVEFIQTSCIL